MRSMSPTPALAAALLLGASFGPGCAGCGDPVDPGPGVTTAPDDDDAVDVQYDRGYYLDMALDSEGRVWLAFRNGEVGILQVSRGSGEPADFSETWDVDGMQDTSGPIPTGGFEGGYYASITIDSANVPHVAHWNQEDGGLRYATLAGDVWAAEDVETGEVGQFTDIEIVDGQPLIAYYDYDAGALKAARKTDTGWQTEVVDGGDVGPDAVAAELDAPDVGQYANLFIDAAGTPWIAYYDRANGNLKVARGGFGAWTVVASYGEGEGTGAWPILTESGGTMFVAFQNLDSHTLWWGTLAAATISAVEIDGGTFTGADAAIAWVDGNATVMYQDAQTNDAKLAVQDGAGGWVLSTHMADGAVGFHNNLVLDASGRLNWACFDHTTTNFVFQRFQP